MNRRAFLKTSSAAAVASFAPLARAASGPRKSVNNSSTAIAAYYLRAQTYTCVPRQVREDMEWMADIGTNYVGVGVLEQDLFAAHENHALIAAEAARVGMKILAVPCRWGGLTAGAPKVPSLFTILNPDTWIIDKKGSSQILPKATGAISSVHHPKTFAFFCETLTEMYKQHSSMAGFIIDEPKCFLFDQSPAAVKALGTNDAPMSAHFAAASAFFGRVCAFAKEKWPDKITVMFQQPHYSADELAAGAVTPHLDYYGCDGRPWTANDDAKMKGSGAADSGVGKILLSGKGEAFIKAARSVSGRKSFFLMENHNLKASMIEPMDRNLPAVLALKPDMAAYYYYPRNVEDADRAMTVIAKHIKNITQA